MIESRPLVFNPKEGVLFVGLEHLLELDEAAGSVFDGEVRGGTPSEGEVAAIVVGELDNDLCLDVLVVPDSEVQVSRVSFLLIVSIVGRVFVGGDVEGVASCEGNVLVDWGVVDGVFPNELQRVVGIVGLEHSDSSLW